MRKLWIGAAPGFVIASAFGFAMTAPLSAQQSGVQPDPNLSTEDQLAPSQMKQAMPGAASEPAAGTAAKPAHAASAHASTHTAEVKPFSTKARIVACSGVFGKDSSHLKLAMTYEGKNVSFTDVDANGGAKTQATVLYANDPKQRLEVWWSNPAARAGTYLIVINGKSTWVAPGGMKLGLTLAQLEKLNKKPFKVKGFDKDGVATVSDWDGGALSDLPGGCKSGMSLKADPKASADAVGAITADKEYSSTDADLRAVKPTVSEVLIGY